MGCRAKSLGVAASADGQFAYVADTGNNRIQRFRIHDSQLQAIAGGNPRPGMQSASYFGLEPLPGGEFKPKRFAMESLASPHGLALFGDRLFVCDTWNHRIVVLSTALPKLTPEEVTPEMAALSYWGSKGRAAGCFQYPKGIAIAPGVDEDDGEVIVADTRNHRLQLFSLSGAFTRGVGGGGNNGARIAATPGRMTASELLSFPTNLCVAGGKIFVTDQRAVTVFSLRDLEPLCVLVLSNPSRLGSARQASQTAAALCVHTAPKSQQMLYVAEYDEHSVRELCLSAEDLRNEKIDASGAVNILKRLKPGWTAAAVAH